MGEVSNSRGKRFRDNRGDGLGPGEPRDCRAGVETEEDRTGASSEHRGASRGEAETASRERASVEERGASRGPPRATFNGQPETAMGHRGHRGRKRSRRADARSHLRRDGRISKPVSHSDFPAVNSADPSPSFRPEVCVSNSVFSSALRVLCDQTSFLRSGNPVQGRDPADAKRLPGGLLYR